MDKKTVIMTSQSSFMSEGRWLPDKSIDNFIKIETRRSSTSSDKSSPHSPSSDDLSITDGEQKTGKRYACNVCDASFTMVGNLNRHKKSHLNHRPYTCNFCLRGFLRRTSYVEHLRLHTGEKPYVCEHCKQTFVRKKCHQMHIRKCFGRYSLNGYETHATGEPAGEQASCSQSVKIQQTRLEMLALQPVETSMIHLEQSVRSSTQDDRPLDLTLSPTTRPPTLSKSSFQAECIYPNKHPQHTLSATDYSPSMSEQDYVIDARVTKKKEADTYFIKSSVHGVIESENTGLLTFSQGDRLLPCKHCQIFFVDCYMYLQHMALHDKTNPFLCTLCSKVCKDAQEFMMHH